MPENTVYVGRPSANENPFYIGQDGTRAEVVELHRRWITGELSDAECRRRFIPFTAEWLIQWREAHHEAATTLRGKNLCCWCPLDQPCHADVLLEFANQ